MTLVAKSLVTAPRRKKSRSVSGGAPAEPLVSLSARRRRMRFLSCSNSCGRGSVGVSLNGSGGRHSRRERTHSELEDRVRDENERRAEAVEEGAGAVRAEDVEDRLPDGAALLDDLLGRRAARGVGCDRRAHGLPGLRARKGVSERLERGRRDEASRTLTTQIGLDKTEVAQPVGGERESVLRTKCRKRRGRDAPAAAETKIDSSMERVARLLLRDLRTRLRASSKHR